MNRLEMIVVLILFATQILAQENDKQDLGYKPKNLDEAIIQLDKLFSDSLKQEITLMDENEFRGRSHMSMGLWVRNNWGLWTEGELSQYFNTLGIFHPDDMSGIILTSYYRHLKNYDYELDKQIKNYQDHWKEAKEHEQKMKTDTAYANRIERESKLNWIRVQEAKIENFPPGTKIRAWVIYSMGAVSGGRTQIEGEIIEWKDINAKVRIDKFLDEKKKQRVFRYNKLKNNEIWVHLLLIEKLN